jgi:hypothetical protein
MFGPPPAASPVDRSHRISVPDLGAVPPSAQPPQRAQPYMVDEPESHDDTPMDPPDSAASLEIPLQPSEKALGKMRRFSTRIGK